jgi:hypothetical protein
MRLYHGTGWMTRGEVRKAENLPAEHAAVEAG